MKHPLLSRLHIGHRKTKSLPHEDSAPAAHVEPPPATAPIRDAFHDVDRGNVTYREALKVRVITFNMHDSCPTGDLTDLLGQLPSSTAALPKVADGRLPHLDDEAGQLNHLIVVCGQECPTGARWSETLDNYLVRGVRDVAPPTPTQGEHPPLPNGTSWGPQPDAQPPLPTIKKWDSQVPTPKAVPKGAENGLLEQAGRDTLAAPARSDADATLPMMRRKSSSTRHGNGPYVLVQRERLMGIYIAVYALRTGEKLVEASDKSTVTAGLLGGRLGNKGGAAVSVRVAGIRYAFISAHLAAHQGQTNARKENVLKIRDELYLDDFSGRAKAHGGDPLHRRDITEDFDIAVFAGDLNYRVDVTRLHADWLVQSQSWEHALEFDQLKNIMRQPGNCWAGWQEGPIRFQPTYKYDVISLDRRVSLRRLPSQMRRPRSNSVDRGSSKRISTSSAASSSLALAGPVPSLPTTPDPGHTSPPVSPQRSARSSISSLSEFLSPTGYASDTAAERKDDPRSQVLGQLRSASTTSLTARINSNDKQSNGGPPELHRSNSRALPPDPDAVYDSSAKQRVQSWTDRILFRSNLAPVPPPKSSPIPPPPISPDEDMLETARPPRRLSLTKVLASPRHQHGRRELSNATMRPKTAPSSAIGTPPRSVSFANPFPPNRTGGLDDLAGTPATLHISFDSDDSALKPRPRSKSEVSASSASGLAPKSAPPASDGHHGLGLFSAFTLEPSRTRESMDRRRSSVMSATMNWRSWWALHAPSFLGSVTTPPHEVEKPLAPTPMVLGPCRGEIEVLEYTSVNDLRKMEAQSDHRPVVATLLIGVGKDE